MGPSEIKLNCEERLRDIHFRYIYCLIGTKMYEYTFCVQ